MNKPGDYLPPLDGWKYEDLPLDIIYRQQALVPANETMLLTLPFPPSANRYWRHFRGHAVRSDEANTYRDLVAQYCRVQDVSPIPDDIGVMLYFYRFNAARDLDNCVKVLMDALQGYAYLNDNQICDNRQLRDYDAKQPRVHALIWGTVGRDTGKIKSRRVKATT